VRPAEDGRERRAQLVREGREEFVPQARRLLGPLARLLGRLPRLPLALKQPLALLLGALAVGDVARDLRRADDLAARPADGRDRERDVDARPVLADADGLVVLDALAADEAREDGRLLVGVVFGDEDGDGPADDLVGRVAEDVLGRAVPARDAAVERLADDGVLGRLDDGLQPVVRDLRAPQPFVPALALVTFGRGGLGRVVWHKAET